MTKKTTLFCIALFIGIITFFVVQSTTVKGALNGGGSKQLQMLNSIDPERAKEKAKSEAVPLALLIGLLVTGATYGVGYFISKSQK